MKICIQRHANPDRTEVRDSKKKWVATLTKAHTRSLWRPEARLYRVGGRPFGDTFNLGSHATAPFDDNVDTT